MSAPLALTPVTGEPQHDAQAIIEAIQNLHGVELIPLEDPRGLAPKGVVAGIIPRGMTVLSVKQLLNEFARHPERRTGRARLNDQASFAEYVRRYEHPGTVIFADPNPEAPRLTAVFDFHEETDGHPGFCEHGGVFPCQLSDEWKAWMAVDGEGQNQSEFAAFLEDRIGDVILVGNDDPKMMELAEMLSARVGGPSALMTLARGLAVNVSEKVQNAVTLQTGEISIRYEQTHSDGGGQPIATPNLFFLAIPVFYGGDPYRIPVRIRYRMQGPAIIWSAHLYRPDRALDDAFKKIVDFVNEGIESPIYLGAEKA